MTLGPLLGKLPGPGAGWYQGVITGTATALTVNVGGNTIPARILDPVSVSVGDTVAVVLIGGPSGQSEAWVLGRLGLTLRPGQGTVKTVPPSSPTITVTGTDGTDYTATFLASYTPAVNDTVALGWYGGQAVVLGKPTTTAAPAPASAGVAPPPAAPAVGTTSFPASNSATWWGPGGWNSWAGGAGNIFGGDYGSGPLTGAWFYAGSAAQLAGRTITRIRFTLGTRRPSGNYNNPAAVSLHTHTSASIPGGNVALGSGSATVTAQPWQGQVTYDLPTSFATDLLAGGGIALSGGDYAGFNGRYAEPNSGLLTLDWSR